MTYFNGKSDSIVKLEQQLIEQSNEITLEMMRSENGGATANEQLTSNKTEAECQILRSSQDDIRSEHRQSKNNRVMASL